LSSSSSLSAAAAYSDTVRAVNNTFCCHCWELSEPIHCHCFLRAFWGALRERGLINPRRPKLILLAGKIF
jgi:hypothetical protein